MAAVSKPTFEYSGPTSPPRSARMHRRNAIFGATGLKFFLSTGQTLLYSTMPPTDNTDKDFSDDNVDCMDIDASTDATHVDAVRRLSDSLSEKNVYRMRDFSFNLSVLWCFGDLKLKKFKFNYFDVMSLCFLSGKRRKFGS
eukprot:549334_1